MSEFPKTIVIEFFSYFNPDDLIEQAIDEAMKQFNNNYSFTLESNGISFGLGEMNLAYFNVERSDELNVPNLIYRKLNERN